MFRENRNRYLIKTPTGYENFKGVQKKIVPDLYTFTFTDGNIIKCSGRHQFLTNIGFLKAEQITPELSISGKIIKKIDIEVGNFEVYDPVGIEKHSTYYSNCVISHNTEFLGSSATLIPGSKLRSLVFKNPITTQDGLDIYRLPEKGRSYVAVVDCAEGVGQDYSALSVIDITELPYRQVAKYRSNQMPPLVFPTIIYNIANKYNEAYVLIETNNVGQQVVDILHYDLEYEFIFQIQRSTAKGQHVSSGFKKSVTFGLKTTTPVKKMGCANLKALVENDNLLIEDFDTISELNTFVRVRDTYMAEEGNNDDIVMTLVLFSWLTAQKFFKEATNSDLRKKLTEDLNVSIDEDLTPVGIFDDGVKEEKINDGEDLWSLVKDRGYNTSTF